MVITAWSELNSGDRPHQNRSTWFTKFCCAASAPQLRFVFWFRRNEYTATSICSNPLPPPTLGVSNIESSSVWVWVIRLSATDWQLTRLYFHSLHSPILWLYHTLLARVCSVLPIPVLYVFPMHIWSSPNPEFSWLVGPEPEKKSVIGP